MNIKGLINGQVGIGIFTILIGKVKFHENIELLGLGKSFSEAIILKSQYDERLFIKLPVKYRKIVKNIRTY